MALYSHLNHLFSLKRAQSESEKKKKWIIPSSNDFHYFKSVNREQSCIHHSKQEGRFLTQQTGTGLTCSRMEEGKTKQKDPVDSHSSPDSLQSQWFVFISENRLQIPTFAVLIFSRLLLFHFLHVFHICRVHLCLVFAARGVEDAGGEEGVDKVQPKLSHCWQTHLQCITCTYADLLSSLTRNRFRTFGKYKSYNKYHVSLCD